MKGVENRLYEFKNEMFGTHTKYANFPYPKDINPKLGDIWDASTCYEKSNSKNCILCYTNLKLRLI